MRHDRLMGTPVVLLALDDVPGDPLALLREWLQSAQRAGVVSPGDTVFATVDPRGQPSTRVLGLQAVDETGLVYFINLATRKGRDLAENPRAAGTLYWRESLQQVNVSGTVERLDEETCDRIWVGRGVVGTAASLASEQGAPLIDEVRLRQRAVQLQAAGRVASRSAQHVAIRLRPDAVEFWQGKSDRLHERLHYSLNQHGWRHWRLQP